ncbi:hypothetical protein EYF80_017834 [Liparis tanakae]|uniref:Uncharacterized protein n=1 Tax=Liparis tanakae TaxID=230148 RepID=A0A4Z2I1U4_9TELE|nr:hypothetical protein EYF80_017834 [Liparis tanakae]
MGPGAQSRGDGVGQEAETTGGNASNLWSAETRSFNEEHQTEEQEQEEEEEVEEEEEEEVIRFRIKRMRERQKTRGSQNNLPCEDD